MLIESLEPEYEELPELTAKMLTRAVMKKGGRPRSASPRQLISLRLPAEVVERWRATGPGWQTRMAEKLITAKPISQGREKPNTSIERTGLQPAAHVKR